MLMADPRVDPSDHNNSAIVTAARDSHTNGYTEVTKLLLRDTRVREKLNSIPTTVKYLKNLNLI
jgi:hypothetical protein